MNHTAETMERHSLPEIVARRYSGATLSLLRVALLAAAFDSLVVALAHWFASYAWPGMAATPHAGQSMVVGLLSVFLLSFAGAYRVSRMVRLSAAITAGTGAVCTAIAIAALMDWPGWPALARQMPIVLAALCLSKFIIASAVGWARKTGLLTRRAVVAGGGSRCRQLIYDLTTKDRADIQVCAIFDDRGDDRSAPQVLGIPKIGAFKDLAPFCRRAEIDLVIVTLPLSAEDRTAQLLKGFSILPIPVYLAEFVQDRSFETGEGGAARLREALPASFRPERRLAKRLFDLVFAVMALCFLWPIMLVAALAIRLDSPGPILFRQKRHGFNDREITVLKFRTMRADAADPEARRVVTAGDPRVTRVGRFLRRSSIDEMPQLFNVLGGSLSLVGPRPHAIHARSSRNRRFEEIVDLYSARHRLPPGMTGLAQINGWRGEVRDDEDLLERVACDLRYIENWSPGLDLLILLRTPASLFSTTRAY